MERGQLVSGYKAVWLFAMFDLPVTTREARKKYAEFRKALLKEGFTMLQYSVYARYFGSEEASAIHRQRVRANLPPKGQVRLMTVTDHQFGKMDVYYGISKVRAEKPPQQLTFL